MKFVCGSCSTRYSIADDRLSRKLLRIRCKTCGEIISVRDPAAPPHLQPAPLEPGRTSGFSSAPTTAPGAVRLAEGPRLSSPPTEDQSWFVSIDGEVRGPFELDEARTVAHTAQAEEIYVWRNGWTDWIAVDEAAEFRRNTKPAPGAPPPPPARRVSEAPAEPAPAPAPASGTTASFARIQPVRVAVAPTEIVERVSPAMTSGVRAAVASAPAVAEPVAPAVAEPVAAVEPVAAAEPVAEPEPAAVAEPEPALPVDHPGAVVAREPIAPATPDPELADVEDLDAIRPSSLRRIVIVAASVAALGLIAVGLSVVGAPTAASTPDAGIARSRGAGTDGAAPQMDPAAIAALGKGAWDSERKPAGSLRAPTQAVVVAREEPRPERPRSERPATAPREPAAKPERPEPKAPAEPSAPPEPRAPAEPKAPPPEPKAKEPPARPERASKAGAEDVQEVFRKHDGAVKQCIERALADDDGSITRGRVTLKVVISDDGSLRRLSLPPPLDQSKLGLCLSGQMRRWEFPAQGKTYTAEVPLVIGD